MEYQIYKSKYAGKHVDDAIDKLKSIDWKHIHILCNWSCFKNITARVISSRCDNRYASQNYIQLWLYRYKLSRRKMVGRRNNCINEFN